MKVRFRQGFFLFWAVLVLLQCAHAQGASKPVPKPSAKTSAKSHTPAAPDAGSIAGGVYHNSFFGFSYAIPYGWVDRTQEMQEGSESGKSMALLSLFERPPEATEGNVNPAVVIAAESVDSYPGLTSAVQYFGPLTEVTLEGGFEVASGPDDFTVGSKQLQRGDYTKKVGTQTMYQASLVTLAKGYVVSFTFIGATKDEVDRLIENLSFGAKKSAK
ncbi:MAG: hypothetical protein LAO03_15385 [Acidobacteriia bacterium]|nr:hypothetical protein [Terriglobia bacterium]